MLSKMASDVIDNINFYNFFITIQHNIPYHVCLRNFRKE